MYYTIVPIEFLLDEHDVEQAPKRKVIEINQIPLMVEQSSESEYQIVQILSSNPQHYLSEKLQPGKKLTLQPLLK